MKRFNRRRHDRIQRRIEARRARSTRPDEATEKVLDDLDRERESWADEVRAARVFAVYTFGAALHVNQAKLLRGWDFDVKAASEKYDGDVLAGVYGGPGYPDLPEKAPRGYLVVTAALDALLDPVNAGGAGDLDRADARRAFRQGLRQVREYGRGCELPDVLERCDRADALGRADTRSRLLAGAWCGAVLAVREPARGRPGIDQGLWGMSCDDAVLEALDLLVEHGGFPAERVQGIAEQIAGMRLNEAVPPGEEMWTMGRPDPDTLKGEDPK